MEGETVSGPASPRFLPPHFAIPPKVRNKVRKSWDTKFKSELSTCVEDPTK